MGSLVPAKTDISVVGTIVRGLTIDPEKEISSSHEARRPLFISPLPPVFRYPPTLFHGPPSAPPPTLPALLFTAANNSFCDGNIVTVM